MTDNEIIKSLECCISSSTALACFKCPMAKNRECYGSNTNINRLVAENALNLINRQRAEIERRKKDKYLIEENGEIELLPRTDIEEIKSEAIKEFVERLTDIIQENVNRSLDNPNGFDYYPIDVFKDIDNLVKEMAEEK